MLEKTKNVDCEKFMNTEYYVDSGGFAKSQLVKIVKKIIILFCLTCNMLQLNVNVRRRQGKRLDDACKSLIEK